MHGRSFVYVATAEQQRATDCGKTKYKIFNCFFKFFICSHTFIILRLILRVNIRALARGFKLHNFGNLGKNKYMIKVNMTINSIKEAVKSLCGKDVTVKLNLGRNKFVTFPAQVNGIYPSLFTVSPFDKNFLGKTAYSYSEILCGRVKLSEQKSLKSDNK